VLRSPVHCHAEDLRHQYVTVIVLVHGVIVGGAAVVFIVSDFGVIPAILIRSATGRPGGGAPLIKRPNPAAMVHLVATPYLASVPGGSLAGYARCAFQCRPCENLPTSYRWSWYPQSLPKEMDVAGENLSFSCTMFMVEILCIGQCQRFISILDWLPDG
jgi:hypothetical protein